jgi:hypothetical protein
VNTDRIDFISAYCDRWCERCAFTARCSTFAVSAAMAMCDTSKEALELALGTPVSPRGPDEDEDEEGSRPWIRELENVALTAADIEEFDRRCEASDKRVSQLPLTRMADDFSMNAFRWLQANGARLSALPDLLVRDAVDVVTHDCFFIAVKINRALMGNDRYRQGEAVEDHPVQNDWNGSAKVALISVTRSEAAWGVIADAIGEAAALEFASQLTAIRVAIERTFPRANEFVRPGFDTPSAATA